MGGGLKCKKAGDALRKIWIKSLNETNLEYLELYLTFKNTLKSTAAFFVVLSSSAILKYN